VTSTSAAHPITARRARCPASAANLGPGFDTLAVALDLHVEVEIRPFDRLRLRAEGEGHELSADQTHLAARVAIDVTGTEGLDITVRSQIPVARGLGSSAALAVASAAAAGAENPMAIGAAVDGHAENAAASVLGGLVTATMLGPEPVAARLPLDDGLAYVVLVPERQVSTVMARQALPDEVPHEDAVFNLGRMGLLLSGLADRRRLVREATEDRLHQLARTPLFPESPVLLAGLQDAGALATCWSGAGPALLAICDRGDGGRLRDAGQKLLAEFRVHGRSLLLHADTTGLVVEPLADAG